MATGAVFRIDLKDLKNLASALKAAEPALEKEAGAALVDAGKIVSRKAQSSASWSTRIPGTIKVRRSGFTIAVSAGGSGGPHAAAFEHGGVGGTFRHPVFGNRNVWVEQKARPFLYPAFVAEEDALVRGVMHALDVVFEKAGFR